MSAPSVPADWEHGPVRAVPDGTAGQWIARVAAGRPDEVAVHQWDRTLTYGALLSGATSLAERLREAGVGPEDRVGLCTDRTPELLVGMLGVLLSGGAFLPLDPELPAARLGELLSDAGARVVVTDAFGRHRCPAGPTFLDIPTTDTTPDRGATAAPGAGCAAGGRNAAYVMYTSGSTGRPKGVVVEHRGLAAALVGFAEVTGLRAGMATMAFAPVSFDASIGDLLAPLSVGARVCLAGLADRADPGRLHRFLTEHRVAWGYLPPVLLSVLDPARLPELRAIFTGGQSPSPEHVARWTADGRRVHNAYGPTETTVCVSMFTVSGPWTAPLPIGVPLPNQRLLVVGADLRPVAVGERGELCVAGVGVARGYLGAPGPTAERFVPDGGGGRLYRTGDVVSWRPDGMLAFHGRADRQVKVRGQRVEVGEVEAVLHALPGTDNAVVELVGERLVAYLTPAEGADAATVREYCAARLPAAAVPAEVVRLAALPLTASDKVDRAALRVRRSGVSARPPVTAGQRDVAALWRRALGTDEPVGLDDDFAAAGGDSLTAMRLVALIRAELDRAVSVVDVFTARTLGTLAETLAGAPPASQGEPSPGSPPALSASQRRLWFVDQLAPDAAAYNIALAERLTGPLDVGALADALRAVVARQAVLRWRVPQHDGAPYAVCDPVGDVPLPVVDLTSALDPDGELARCLTAHAAQRFDLATGPLLAARLVRLGDADHVLSITAHHAVFDGWSAEVFYRDLARAYDAARGAGDGLSPPPISFADYVAWRAGRDTRDGAADLSWWRDHLAGAPTVLDLPGDRSRPAEQSYSGGFVGTVLPVGVDAAVRAVAARAGATPSAVLLAAFGQLLSRLTGRHDMVVGTPAADRGHPAFVDLVGFFVDIVPLRLRPDHDAVFLDAVHAAHAELLGAVAHPAAPLERIVDALRLRREASRPPLVQVLFNVFNFAEPSLSLSDVDSRRVPAGVPGSPFDLTVYLVERDARFALELVYNTDLFDAARIGALLAGYATLLGELVGDPDRPARLATMRPPGSAPDAGRTVLDAAGRPAGIGEYGSVATRSVDGWRPTGEYGRLDPAGAVVLAADDASPVAPPSAPTRVVPPDTDTERLVAGVWCEVLSRRAVGVTDNFFDIGGDSMAIVSVRARLTELLGRDIRVVDLFRYPNIRALSDQLDRSGTDTAALDRAAARAAARRGRARRRTPSRTTGRTE